jgi:hypothetical protein
MVEAYLAEQRCGRPPTLDVDDLVVGGNSDGARSLLKGLQQVSGGRRALVIFQALATIPCAAITDSSVRHDLLSETAKARAMFLEESFYEEAVTVLSSIEKDCTER